MYCKSAISVIILLLTTWVFPRSVFSQSLNLNERISTIDSSNIFEDPNYYNWGSSVVKGEDGKYHLFYSRWQHGKRDVSQDKMNYIFDGFSGWLKYSEIAYAISDKLEGPYHFVKTILKGDVNSWDQYTIHNPQIRKLDDKYYLYYISNTYDPLLQNDKMNAGTLEWFRYNANQKIGVIYANTLNELISGDFVRLKEPIMQPDGKRLVDITNNPSVTQGPDGQFFMMFKSRNVHAGPATHWIATAPKPEGPYMLRDTVFTNPDMACEDPFLWYDSNRKSFYAVMKNFNRSKKLIEEFGALALIESKDGLRWKPSQHTLVSNKELRFSDGRTIKLDHLERPFLYIDEHGEPTALFAAGSVLHPPKGNPEDGYNSFNVCIPLKK